MSDDPFLRRTDLPAAEVPGPPREIVGYGEHPPSIRWRGGGAKVAVQIVVNYEEGSEKTFAMGDGVNDILYELPFALEGQRDLAVESMYEYGSRAGIWRLFRVFDPPASRSRSSRPRWRWNATPRSRPSWPAAATSPRATATGGATTSR